MRDISWQELFNCETYAEKVLERYKRIHKGKVPTCVCETEYEVRKYNRSVESFNKMFGYPIRGYVEHIVISIGIMIMDGEMNE